MRARTIAPALCGLSLSDGSSSPTDHGYSLGGFRIDSQKEQVYDHNTRVPLVLHVPNAVAGGFVDTPVSMVDIAPTLLELAGGSAAATASMDGLSFAAHVRQSASGVASPAWPRAAVLIACVTDTARPGGLID